MTLIDFEYPHQPGRWRLSIEADWRLRLVTAEKVTLFSPTAIPSGGWTHVAVVKTKERLASLVNGRTEASAADTSGIPATGFTVGRGCDATGFYRGLMDEVLYYDRALTETEVRALYELPFKEPSTAEARTQ
jgi:hypothetical protein